MTLDDLKSFTLSSAAKLVRSKQVSPLELTKATLERIHAINERMGVFISITADHALSLAKEAEDALIRGVHLGPLHGVPVSLKDIFDTKGILTTAGSRVFRDRIPTEDSTVAGRLNSAGAILVGKTNMHEFAFGVTSENPHYGTVRNPWNEHRISGGSSGGSATSVALSASLGSVGSDTGGSIRIPAALSGAVGLKPTYGRVSVAGVIPLSWSLDHIGPITKTVEDAALMLEVIAGSDRKDPYSSKIPTENYRNLIEGGMSDIRIGLPLNNFYQHLDAEVDIALRRALSSFEKMGADLIEVDFPNARFQRAIFANIATPEAFSYHEQTLNSKPNLYGEDVRTRIEAGRLMLSTDFVRAQRARSILRNEVIKVLETVDLLITPTTPISAPQIGKTAITLGDRSESIVDVLTRNTRLFNLTGLPAISVPCGFTSDNLPIGLQIIGRPFKETSVLKAAYAFEQDAGWWKKSPDI